MQWRSVDDMENPEAMMQNCILNVCQPGSALLAAGYCLYSSSTVFVLTIGAGVFGFTYDSIVGEFVLSHPDMKACPLSRQLLHFPLLLFRIFLSLGIP